MSYTLACPVCNEPISIILVNDWEGDGIMGGPVSRPEISELSDSCVCELTDAQINALLEAVDYDALIDSYCPI